MAVDVVRVLTLAGVMVVGGVVASLAFRRTGIPDILFLIALGVLLGPVTGVVDVDALRTVVPFVGAIAIVIILFDGGLEIKMRDLGEGVRAGVFLAFVVFSATAALCALVGRVVGGLPWGNAWLLGMAFGGAGVLIVIPLVRALGVKPTTVTIVSVEAAVSDVLVVIGVYSVAGALAAEEFGILPLAQAFVLKFVGGTLAGLLVGRFWARAMRAFEGEAYEYVLTLAVVFLVYSLAEAVGASGLMAALAMGFVLGNTIRKDPVRGDAPAFGGSIMRSQHEVVFFVRSFFFVGLGALIDPALFLDARFLALGALLAVAVVAGRLLGVAALWPGRGPPVREQRAVAFMFPLGLAAAALSLVPSRTFGIPGTERFGDVAAVVIVLTNVLAAILVAVFARRVALEQTPETSAEHAKAP